jgi:hypothetical protein
MTDKMALRNYLILNINTQNNKVYIQVNRKDNEDICYNITFENQKDYLVCQGFLVPCFSSGYEIGIYGDRNTRTLLHCLKVLPKMLDNKVNLLEFLEAIIRKEKLNYFQINVNSAMEYSQAKKINILTLSTIQTELTKLNFPIAF